MTPTDFSQADFSNAILDNAGALIVVLDTDGRICKFNRACEKLSGFTSEEVIGEYPWDTFLPDDRAQEIKEKAFEEAISNQEIESSQYTNYWKSKNGSFYLTEWNNTLMRDNSGNVSHMVCVGRDITEKVKSEKALMLSEKKLKDILNSIYGFVGLYTLDGVLILANDAPLVAAGICRDEVIGQYFWDTYWWNYDENIQTSVKNALKKAATGEVVRYETEVRVANDEHIIIDVTFGPLRNENDEIINVVGFGVDITDRKRAEEDYQSTIQVLNAVLDTTPVMMAYLDTDMNFIRVNKAYAEADDKIPEFYSGKNHFELYPNEENEEIFKQVVITGEPYIAKAKPFEYEHNPERGVTHWDWTLTPIKDQSGVVTGLVLSLLNVTDRINALEQAANNEAQYKNLSELLEEKIVLRTQELRVSLAEKEALLKEVHHRVKNNLAMVSAFINLQKRQTEDGLVKKSLTDCENRIYTMALVHKKLYQSKDLSNIDLEALLKELFNVIYIPGEHGHVELELAVDKFSLDMDLAIPCALIMNELMNNSFKHAFGSKLMQDFIIKISIEIDAGNVVHMKYSDNGCGLPGGFDLDELDTLGYQLIKIFVDQLSGDMAIKGDNGTDVEINFKV